MMKGTVSRLAHSIAHEWEEKHWSPKPLDSKAWNKRRGNDSPGTGLGAGVRAKRCFVESQGNDGTADSPLLCAGA